MTKETMNIHQGLIELKLLDSRITKGISAVTGVIANRANNYKISGVSIDEWKNNEISAYESVTDLIKRRKAIKKAISLSNAVTTVEVGGIIYTVAEAIELKNSGIYYEELLLDKLRNNLTTAITSVDKKNAVLDKDADEYIIRLFGLKEQKNGNEEVNAQREVYIKNNTYQLVDALKINDEINKLEKTIYEFKSKIDAALSVSNAITTIEIEY